jgi:hypothetical protein
MRQGRRRGAGRIAALAVVAACLIPPAAAAQTETGDALAFQYELASDMPLRNAPWVGTHNSFNSSAEMGPALSAMDSNQRIAIVDQLDLGVRSLELDVHWFPSVQAGGFAPVVCHATGEHAGCTVEKPLAVVLGEIAGWLDEHPREVLLLYLEDHLDGEAGHDAGAAALEAELGDRIHRPPPGGCADMPLDLTRDQIRAGGAQVLLVSDCGAGAAWPSLVFDFSRHEETRPRGYRDFPDCGPDFDRATYDNELVRYFEDSTRLTEGASHVGASSRDDGITPETAAAMTRCGVDLFGLDQLTEADPRLDALVWTWAPGRPAAGDCAVQRADARWETRACRAGRLPAACRTAAGSWIVTTRAVRASDAGRACTRQGAVHAAPRTGHEAQLLRVGAGAEPVWLGLRRESGAWRPLDAR